MPLRKHLLRYLPPAGDTTEPTGVVSDFQRFSIHDGPGIRTIVFLKGCPLRCLWCQNPENIRFQPELLYIGNNCIACGKCLDICPEHCLTAQDGPGVVIDRRRCALPDCGLCQSVCYANAINICGRYLTVAQVLEEVELDREFYERSGGGVTFSGGEPFAQPRFLEALAREAQKRGLHTAVETCGQAGWEVMRPALGHMDLVLFDVKHMDPAAHERLTGAPNRRILDNLRRIDALGIPLRLRLPLIPGHNDTEENLRRTAELAASLTHLVALDVLPYHRMGEPKWGQLRQDYPLHGLAPHNKEALDRLAEVLRAVPIPVTIGG
jgi:pyruvate formate lyase activating enzyme